nr:immunoglobulin heavy chain junction region [Macaca mulatta]MOV37861.1 immunoglobulin heavy chain junction region [Macaca mulatta]MOV39463.1 immunoglobulin heavy chain junction region [Macaca mulatta]MOV39586.1 immunoglobulin heavy chain junction region [Macaca mulatta]MOV40233.1 immunoglobulin heavy chain junction region [Macaca mulatta]
CARDNGLAAGINLDYW